MPELSKGKVALYFLGFCFLAVALGVFEFFGPIGGDTAVYTHYGRQINQGYLLYRDLWQFKPPGIYHLFAFATQIFPDHVNTFRAELLILNLAASIFLYRAALLRVSQMAALTAAAFYLFLTNLSGYFNWDGPYPESFLTFFGVLGYYGWIKFEVLGKKSGLFFAGLMVGSLLTIKQTSLSFGAACGLILIYNLIKKANDQNLRQCFVFIAGCLCIPAVWVGYFIAKGAGPKLVECLIWYPSGYIPAGHPVLDFVKLLFFSALPLLLVWIFAVKTVIGNKNRDIFLWLWLVMGLLIVYAPGRGYNHYFLETLMPLLFLSLQGIEAHLRRSPKHEFSMLLLIFLCFSVVGLSQAPRMIYLIKHRLLNKEPIRAEVLRDYFAGKSDYKKTDRIFTWFDNRIYYESGMQPALSFIDINSHPFGDNKDTSNPMDFDKITEGWCENPPRYFINKPDQSFFESRLATEKMRGFLERNYKKLSGVKLEGIDVYEVNSQITCQ